MVRVLAVADEIADILWRPSVRGLRPDLVVGCGDLPADYLDYLVTATGAPLVFVPGNHDPDLSSVTVGRAGLAMRSGMPCERPGPCGTNADGGVVDVAGLRLAGLGGCVRYRPGPNQYSQSQFARRARALGLRAAWRHLRDGREIDLLITHAPPAGVGDRQDAAHLGIAALHPLIRKLRPPLLLHGHIHPYGAKVPDRQLGTTKVCNVVGYRVFDIAACGPRPVAAG